MPLPDLPSTDRPAPRAGSVALWTGGTGAVALAIGSWVASRALVELGTAAFIAVVVAAIGLGLVVAGALLSAAAPPQATEDAESIARVLQAVARGDFRQDPSPARVAGPVALCTRALTGALASLRPALGAVASATREAAQRSEELGTQCAAAHLASQRAAEQAAQVAERASVATEQAHQAALDLSRLQGGIDQLEGGARATGERETRAATAGARVTADLGTAATGLDQLTARFSAAGTELAGLARSVEDVQEFVALVRKMARQSKLLSLNAAMEAARAGDSGSGFGVVAAEVRRLARSSSEAADRTERLLQELLSRAGAAQDATRETLALARAAHESVQRSRTTVAEWRAGDAPEGALREGIPESPGAMLAAIAARHEQLAGDLAGLAHAAKDARLAGSAQVARVQDLLAASHSLTRSAARATAALEDFRVEVAPADRTDTGTPRAAAPGRAAFSPST